MKPNILIINPDQMRADSMRHMGNPAAYTPNLDALAGEGVSFSNAFCQNTVCVPSRCSFMTGLYPHTLGHRTMGHLQQPWEENLFSDMKQAGYYTASSVRGDLMAGQYSKYHKALIDEYLPVLPGKRRPTMFTPDRGATDSDTYFSFMGGVIPTVAPDGNFTNMDDMVFNGALRFIKRRPKDKPFFMHLGLNAPHPPYNIEKKYYDLIDKSKLPPRVPTIRDADGKPLMERGLRNALRVGDWDEDRLDGIRIVYLAMVAKMDDQIGRLLEVLKSEGIYENTAVLVISDHGDYTGDYGIVEKSQNCFPDCITNVPFLIKPPKGVPVDPGVNDTLVELTDLCATVAGMSGAEIKRAHFSKSMLPTVADKNKPHREYVTCEGGRNPGEVHCMEYDPATHNPDSIYAPRMELQAREDGTHTKAAMLRTEQYKYIKRQQESDEFYDLSRGERFNLIGDPAYSDKIKEMQMQMLGWYMETCDTVPLRQDSRMPMAFVKNIVRAAKLPAFAGDLLGLCVKLSGMTPSQFMGRLERLGEKLSGKRKKY